ncbi:unnamed protein product [Thelazia callipaeda]|uniref:Alpha-tubulin N-acetyltransferase n=1 Tax=Thelazia callipaeda TaxID=103827 RepID=A0A0N5CUD5_THECL|nr:unnamed protein product [Thelazia callipaeda]
MWWSRCLLEKFIRCNKNIVVTATALAGSVVNYEDKSITDRSLHFSKFNKWHEEGPLVHPSDGTLISRRVVSDYDETNLQLRLYQYEACPFCCKVRAFLDYYGFSYDIVEVSPLTRKEIKKLDSVSKLPTVIAQGDQKLSDSSLIISILASYMMQNNRSLEEIINLYPKKTTIVKETGKEVVTYPNMYKIIKPGNALSKLEEENARKEEKWRKWVDEHFVHLIVPNVYRSWGECIQMFRWFSEAGQWEKLIPAWERYITIYVGAVAMYILSKKLRKKYDDADVRQLLISACNEWLDALGNSSFLGGQEPNLADLAFYGAMNSFIGSETFYELCNKTEINIWYERMRDTVNLRAGAGFLQKSAHKGDKIISFVSPSRMERGQVVAGFTRDDRMAEKFTSEHDGDPAQGLRRALTTYDKLVGADDRQVLYLMWKKNPNNENASIIIGLLKIGYKNLYLTDPSMRLVQVTPLCVLDFYVHDSLQRQGYGHALFDYMLEHEKSSAENVAIDKPSESLLQFMNKHYGLNEPLWQVTNFVVYPSFFKSVEYSTSSDSTKQKYQKSAKKVADKYGEARVVRKQEKDSVGSLMNDNITLERIIVNPETAQGKKISRDFGHHSIW